MARPSSLWMESTGAEFPGDGVPRDSGDGRVWVVGASGDVFGAVFAFGSGGELLEESRELRTASICSTSGLDCNQSKSSTWFCPFCGLRSDWAVSGPMVIGEAEVVCASAALKVVGGLRLMALLSTLGLTYTTS